MKARTNELTGAALDWAVAKCEGATDFWFDTVATHWVKLHGQDRALSYGWAQSYLPSTNWEQGGPIIEREKLTLLYDSDWKYDPTDPEDNGERWMANTNDVYYEPTQYGPTPLVAAMRCYVASKLGDEVEIPEEFSK